MTAIAPTVPSRVRPAGKSPQFTRRVRMVSGPGAAAMARAEVAAAIRAGGIAVDPDVALLLTSELVTNAVTHGAVSHDSQPTGPDDPGASATMAPVLVVIAADATGLRVEVHDGSADLPLPKLTGFGADEESGRGLLLVMSLGAEWGFYRTPAGKAVYFTLDARSVS